MEGTHGGRKRQAASSAERACVARARMSWTREEAQQRAAWSRSGASEWEAGGAAQPSADDDEYLRAAREAQSRRMGTLTIPVPDDDFDALDFEAAASAEQDDEPQGGGGGSATISVPVPSLPAGDGDGDSGAADGPLAAADAPPAEQWFPARRPPGPTCPEVGGGLDAADSGCEEQQLQVPQHFADWRQQQEQQRQRPAAELELELEPEPEPAWRIEAPSPGTTDE